MKLYLHPKSALSSDIEPSKTRVYNRTVGTACIPTSNTVFMGIGTHRMNFDHVTLINYATLSYPHPEDIGTDQVNCAGIPISR